jgi:hypothetical protein
MSTLLLPLSLILLSLSARSALTLASFNIRIYSTGSRTDGELGQIADRLQQFDLVAIR